MDGLFGEIDHPKHVTSEPVYRFEDLEKLLRGIEGSANMKAEFWPKLTLSEVREQEEAVGVKFPAEYVQIITELGGKLEIAHLKESSSATIWHIGELSEQGGELSESLAKSLFGNFKRHLHDEQVPPFNSNSFLGLWNFRDGSYLVAELSSEGRTLGVFQLDHGKFEWLASSITDFLVEWGKSSFKDLRKFLMDLSESRRTG